jgi:hypothetical protein
MYQNYLKYIKKIKLIFFFKKHGNALPKMLKISLSGNSQEME